MISEAATALSALKTGLDITKELRTVDAALGNADLKLRIADLADALAEAKIAILSLTEELGTREKEVERLKATIRTVESDVFERNGFKYPLNADGVPEGRPYCPSRLAIEGVALRLVAHPERHAHFSFCPSCKTEYARDAKPMFNK